MEKEDYELSLHLLEKIAKGKSEEKERNIVFEYDKNNNIEGIEIAYFTENSEDF